MKNLIVTKVDNRAAEMAAEEAVVEACIYALIANTAMNTVLRDTLEFEEGSEFANAVAKSKSISVFRMKGTPTFNITKSSFDLVGSFDYSNGGRLKALTATLEYIMKTEAWYEDKVSNDGNSNIFSFMYRTEKKIFVVRFYL